ncbi:hypothetical protein [Tenacibaculum bernardetii]|uniref:hypothetical protein n=1 Tax=Tenacibaculum bernardetii TaxID=3021375 RepID=UPI0023AE715C|nr:hypothetical protein [Tenacibaculum bernardetii]
MNKFKIVITLFFITSIVNAQEKNESFQKETAISVKEKFPSARLFNFEYGQSLSRDFNSELLGVDFNDAKIKSQQTFKASANIPLHRSKNRKWAVTGSLNYQLNSFEFEDINEANEPIFEQNGTVNFHNFSTAISSTYFSSLFKKPVIYNASLIVDGNEKGLERIKSLVGLSFILKRTQRTTMTLGAIVFVDPTSQIPFFPTFSYNHKFKNSKWELDFILPQRLLFRRFVGENGRFSIGSTFGGNGFYVNIENNPAYTETFEYSQLEIKSGVMYEYRFNNFLIGTFQGGLQNFISNQLTEKGVSSKDYIYKNTQDATGYFNVGISIDPFAKKK